MTLSDISIRKSTLTLDGGDSSSSEDRFASILLGESILSSRDSSCYRSQLGLLVVVFSLLDFLSSTLTFSVELSVKVERLLVQSVFSRGSSSFSSCDVTSCVNSFSLFDFFVFSQHFQLEERGDSQYFGHQHLDERVALEFQLLEYFLSFGSSSRVLDSWIFGKARLFWKSVFWKYSSTWRTSSNLNLLLSLPRRSVAMLFAVDSLSSSYDFD